MKVTVTYFKTSGKFYSIGEYESEHGQMWQVLDEVRAMFAVGERPGLVDGPQEFHVVVDSDEGYPGLMLSDGEIAEREQR